MVAVLLAEEGHCAEFLGFGDGHCAVFLEGQTLADHLVHAAFHIADLLMAQFLEVAEVETQALRVDARAFLLDMLAQHLTQGVVHKVGGRVVAGGGLTLVGIDGSMECGGQVVGKRVDDMHNQSVFLLGINNF